MSGDGSAAALYAHLGTGASTVCWCWAVVRRDGVVLGFTDHDLDLGFEGIVFRAGTGMTAAALMQTTGLSVDNSEALGALSEAGIRAEEILAGRYDGAEVRAWLVNWAAPEARILQFRGSFGQIRQEDGQFRAELRGLTEALNQPQGRVYQAGCGAALGDGACGFDLATPGYREERGAEAVREARLFRFANFGDYADRWFERGRLSVLSGAAAGLSGMIKNDRLEGTARSVELWQALGAEIAPGDLLRIEAGCDKRAESCRLKFHNFANFRGFPHIPGDDWLMSYPVRAGQNDGGALR